MTVSELIKKLEQFDGDDEVRYDYDYGYELTEVNFVFYFDSKSLDKRLVVLANDNDPYIADKNGYVWANGEYE